jgi:hypothetical protein
VQRERGSGGSGGAQARRPPVTGAEARHPRPGTGHGYRYPYYSHGYYPYYGGYYPYWGWYGVPYYGYYDPFYWGFGVSYGGGYGYGGGYYPGYQYADAASIRTFVEPEKTKVFVDGAYAGEVDDFDGMFQRLYVSPGRHDVTFKLDGYRSHRVMIYAVNDRTIKIRHNMQKGPGEETVEDLSGGITEPPYRMTDNYPPPRDREEPPPAYEERRGARDEGALRLDVRPDDASVYVDGEFVGSARRAGLVPLPPGRHRLEVVRPGFRTVERDVEIQSGRTETVAIDLQRN